MMSALGVFTCSNTIADPPSVGPRLELTPKPQDQLERAPGLSNARLGKPGAVFVEALVNLHTNQPSTFEGAVQ